MICRQRLYLTAGNAALVAAGDPEAHTLYASPGDEIPDEAAERFGLVDGALPGFEPESDGEDAGEAEAKELAPGEDKEKAPGEDKSAPGKPKAPAKPAAPEKAAAGGT